MTKYSFAILTLIMALFNVSCGGGSSSSGSTAVKNFKTDLNILRGINLGNRLDAPSEGAWAPALLEKDFQMVAARGFDHIRLPVRFNAHIGSGPDYIVDPTFFTRIDWAIDQCLKNNLSVIIDWHNFDEIHSDPNGQKAKFQKVWRQIAVRYQDKPSSVMFELLNEPHGNIDNYWNQIAAETISIIRESNSTRIIIVEGANYGMTWTINQLVLPNDSNVVASVHIYEPGLFTLQGRDFMGPIWGTNGVVFPGPPPSPITPVAAAQNEPWAANWFSDYNNLPANTNPCGPKSINDQINQALAYASSSGHTVYNGEWGAHKGADMQSRVNYMGLLARELEKNNIAWAVWDDSDSLKMYDRDTDTWTEPLTSAILPQ